MKKKLLFILSVMLIAVCCAFGVSARAEHRPYTEDEGYKIVDNVVYVQQYNKKSKEKFYSVVDYFATEEAAEKAKKITIASKIDGIPVKEIKVFNDELSFIEEYFMESYPNVKSVSIPNTVVKIGRGAFSTLDGVKEITLPNSVTSVSEYAFSNMEKLEKVTLSPKITAVSANMFSHCPKLSAIKNTEKITVIDRNAFYGCKKLKSFKIPENVKKIYEGAFAATGITEIRIPVTAAFITDDGYDVFYKCKSLKKVVFTADGEQKKYTVKDGLFEGCTALEKVYFPKNVKKITIAKKAFYNCEKLAKLYNTDNITNIGAEAFRGCKALTSLTVSSKVTQIGEKAFYGCAKLKKVTVNSKKTAPSIGKKAFGKTAEGIKFVAKNNTAAKSWKSALKKSGLKNMTVCYVKYVNV